MLRFLRISLLLSSLAANGQPFQTVLVAPSTDSYEAGFVLAPMGVTAGQTTSFPASGSGSRVLLSRYNASGNALINRVYPNLPGQTASCKAIDTKPVASGGGLAAGVYVLGNVQKPTATGLIMPGLFITRLNAVGVVLWHREYIPPANQ